MRGSETQIRWRTNGTDLADMSQRSAVVAPAMDIGQWPSTAIASAHLAKNACGRCQSPHVSASLAASGRSPHVGIKNAPGSRLHDYRGLSDQTAPGPLRA